MTSRTIRYLAFACFCIAVLACAIPAQRNRPQPRDPLTRYAAMLDQAEPRARWEAVRGLARLGTKAVPTLVEILQTDGAKSPVPTRAEFAVRALREMQGAAVRAVPALLALLEKGTPNQRPLAVRALEYVAPFDRELVARTRTLLTQEMCDRKRVTVAIQRRIGPGLANLEHDPTKIDTPVLVTQLRSRDATRRVLAARWLRYRLETHGESVENRPTVAKELRAALRERQPQNTEFYYEFGNVKTIRVIRTHRQQHVRQELALTLLMLEPTLPLVGWTALSTHADPSIRQRSVLALGASNQNGAVPTLIAALADPDKFVAWDAIAALGMLGPRARSAVPNLEKLATGSDRGKAARSRAALRLIRRT